MKMRKIAIFATLLIFSFEFSILHSQKTLLSPSAALKTLEIRDGRCQEESLHAFVTLAEGTDLKAFDAYGVKVNSIVPLSHHSSLITHHSMMTVQIPTKHYLDFVASGLCDYIELGNELYPYLDKARADMGVDYIHQGVNLPQGYDGTGVVVGIIDGGFDYGHPTFFDTTGTTLRIKRVWQQFDDSGNPPAGFSYGTEYATPDAILGAVTDLANQTHGSHVAGIAAGSGPSRSHRGMAPGADIVIVASAWMEATTFDAIQYIHEYARSVHKPCVINMSFGTLAGPHDGTDAFSTILQNYLRDSSGVALDSLIIVASAANSGSTMNHFRHQFSATDTMSFTYTCNTRTGNVNLAIDSWGAVGDTFSVSLALYDYGINTDHTFVMDMPFVSSAVDTVFTVDFTSPRDSVYHCNIVVTHDNPRNHRPSIILNLYKNGFYNTRDIFRITLKSTSADVHLWSDDVYFYKANTPQAQDGDYDYLIGGEGANGDDVICVGSYATRTKFYGDDGTYRSLSSDVEGDLSYFSSHGPTWDGRVKPDICAPGQKLASAVNASALGPLDDVVDSTFFGGSMRYYALMQGTSMSSPAAAGIIALWLQHNPALNVDSVRTLLHDNGIRDRFARDIPAEGSNEWGWGKIDAFAGLPTPSAPLHYVYTYPYDPTTGHVVGRGRHPEGQLTIEAVPTAGYGFDHWNNTHEDVTGNPFTFNLVSDTVLLARFVELPCDTISQFPWEAVFDQGSLICWERYSQNVSLSGWREYSQGSMVSVGLVSSGGPDAMLITPPVRVESQTALFYNATSSSREPNFDSLAVVVFNAEGETIGLYPQHLSTSNSGDFIVSLDPYAGQVVKLGFHHFACSATSMVVLSNVKIDHHVGIMEIENSNLKIITSGLDLRIDNPDGETVSLYDITGRHLATHHSTLITHHFSTPGVYIVKAGNRPVRKLVVLR